MTIRERVGSDVHVGLQGRDVLAAFVAFFGVVFAVNGYFLHAALSTHTGVVAVEPYRKGLAYNDRIAADERQALLGWAAKLDVERSGQIVLTLTGRQDAPVSDVVVTGNVGRPATGASDQALAFREAEPGRYVGSASPLGAGSWIVSLDIVDRRGDASPVYRLRRRVWLKP